MSRFNAPAIARAAPLRAVLPLATLMHLTVDGVCAANLARYALAEPLLAPILFHFGLYTLVAFGGQWAAGWWLDRRPAHITPAFVLAPLLLAAGSLTGFGIAWQAVLLGLGNCLFHAAGGALVLRSTRSFGEPGVFVSSGAVGLALGLNSLCGVGVFLALGLITGAALAALLHARGLPEVARHDAAMEAATTPLMALAALLLLACVVLRGANGGGGASDYVLLFPCVFALGKVLGGLCGDRLGYQNTALLIFLLGFVALQGEGLAPALLLALAWNMTMPLTLRLLHRARPGQPGLMFGLAAGCLLPGYFFREHLSVLPTLLLVLQFLALTLAGWLLLPRRAAAVAPCPST